MPPWESRMRAGSRLLWQRATSAGLRAGLENLAPIECALTSTLAARGQCDRCCLHRWRGAPASAALDVAGSRLVLLPTSILPFLSCG